MRRLLSLILGLSLAAPGFAARGDVIWSSISLEPDTGRLSSDGTQLLLTTREASMTYDIANRKVLSFTLRPSEVAPGDSGVNQGAWDPIRRRWRLSAGIALDASGVATWTYYSNYANRHALATSPDGSRTVTATQGSLRGLVWIDSENEQVLAAKTVALPDAAMRRIELLNSGHVVCDGPKVYNMLGRIAWGRTENNPYWDISSDGKQIYQSSGANLLVLDGATGTVVRSMPNPIGARPFCVSGDGKSLFFLEEAADGYRLRGVDSATGALRSGWVNTDCDRLLDANGGAVALGRSWDPELGWNPRSVQVVQLDSTTVAATRTSETNYDEDEDYDLSLATVYDGKQAFVYFDYGRQTFTVREFATGKVLRRVVGRPANGHSYAVNATTLAYLGYSTTGKYGLYIIDLVSGSRLAYDTSSKPAPQMILPELYWAGSNVCLAGMDYTQVPGQLYQSRIWSWTPATNTLKYTKAVAGVVLKDFQHYVGVNYFDKQVLYRNLATNVIERKLNYEYSEDYSPFIAPVSSDSVFLAWEVDSDGTQAMFDQSYGYVYYPDPDTSNRLSQNHFGGNLASLSGDGTLAYSYTDYFDYQLASAWTYQPYSNDYAETSLPCKLAPGRRFLFSLDKNYAMVQDDTYSRAAGTPGFSMRYVVKL